MTTATTEPATQYREADPDQDSRGGLLASLPGFGRRPPPPPNASSNPDQPIPAAESAAGGDSKDEPASIPAFFKQRSKSYAKIAETLLKAAGGWLNAIGDEDSEAFLPDDDDVEMIPPPLGRLAARRLKLGADPDQLSDLEDLGMAAVGIGVWLAKGITARWEARRERRRLEASAAVHRESGDGT